MIPITPRGMRMRPTCKPFGRRHILVTSRTGSGSATTSRSPFAIAWMREGLSAMRSRTALETPPFVAKSKSFLFSSIRKALCALSRSAISSKARFFSTDDSGANRRAATLACLPRRSASCFILSFVPDIRFSQDDQVVAMNNFFVCLITQHFFNPACMQSFDLIQLLSAIVDQAARELPSVRVQAAHTLADTECAADFFQARWQKTLPLLHDGIVGALIDDDLAGRF